MPDDPYLDLRRRVQRRMEARLALAEGEVNTERSLRQIEMALGLPRGRADDRAALKDILQEHFDQALLDERVRLSEYERRRLFGLIVGDMLGLGPLDGLLEDPGVSAVYVLDTRAIYVERGGRLVSAGAAFDDARQLNKIARRIFEPMGYWVGEGAGMASGHLADGARVDAVLAPEASPDGVQLVIRRQPPVPPKLAALVEAGWLPERVADFLRGSLLARRNILIAGGRRSGKTALLAALAGSLPDEARLVVVERALEMRLARQHAVRLEARPQQGTAYSAEALLRRAPELLPDWVWLGEVTAEVAGAYAEMLARVGLCSTLRLRDPGGPSALRAGPRQALDRLTALALRANPQVPAAAVERQIAAGLDLLVFMRQDASGMPIVGEVALVGREDGDWRLEGVYEAQSGSMEGVASAAGGLAAAAALFTARRTAPAGETPSLAQPLFDQDGSLTDPTLDEVYLVGGQVTALREEDGAPVSAELEDAAGEIERLAQAGDEEALLWAAERPDGTRLALVRAPVSVGGAAVSAERFAARPGGLKRLADLGMLTPEAGSLVVGAARAGLSVLVCGPAGSGKRAFMRGLLRVLQDAPEWQVVERLDAAALSGVLSAAGQGRTLAGVDCADGVDPLAALSAWSASQTGEGQAAAPGAPAGAFRVVVRMGRVAGRQRMIMSIEEVIAEGDAYRLEPLFAARQVEDNGLRLVKVGEASF